VAVDTLTFLFTDIEGSTTFLRKVGEDVYAQVLADHHGLIRSALAAHGGVELNTLGDGFFAGFTSPRACVAAVLEMQQALGAHAWPAREHVRVRMGVHTGEATQTPNGPVGLDVHRAARIAAVAHGGQVLLSETAAVLVRDALPPGAALRDLGAHRLKDLGRPERIFQLEAPGLEAQFAPLRSLGNPALPNNLPVQPTSFIGRDRELAEVRALIESAPLVTVTGAGGSGKTRLSVQVAAELLDGSGDGVWLVELATVTDEDAVVPAIASALGIARRRGRSLVETLLDALAPQNVLILLDNCEHLIDACAKIADAILRNCPRAHLLATSREPLGIAGEAIYRVPSLSLPRPQQDVAQAPASSDAVALFVDRARAQGVDLAFDAQTAPLVVSVCRRLDGMPLAIELAASRLRTLSLTELSDRLDQRFRLLTGGSRTAVERQQTLRATVDWSYSLLTAAERQLLRRLAVFAESFDIEAAEAVCGFGDIDATEVAGLLGSLADKSLVLTEQAGTNLRYRLLETIRQFAAERLGESGANEVASVGAAHCEYFLSIAERAAPHLSGPDQGSRFAGLTVDQANLKRAAEFAADSPHGTRHVLRFGIALRRYWMARSAEADAVSLLRPVLDRPDARMDPALFGAAAVTALIAGRGHDPATSQRLATEIVELARAIGDDRMLAEALSVLCGNYYFFTGDPERGLPLGEEAVKIARQLGDDVLLASSMMSYLLCRDLIDPAHSEPLFAEAIACTRRSGDRLIACLLHNNAGVHALRAGDYPAARSHLQQAAQAAREIGEQSHHLSVNLGWVLRQEKDPLGAEAEFEVGLRMSRRTGDRSGIAYSSLGLACVAADLGDWRRSATVHGFAQAYFDRLPEPWQEPEARYRSDSLAKVRSLLGDHQFERAYAEGMELSFDDAIDLALQPVRPAA
jgi:predicted ATPase/class 3 adenylate cyclase